MNTKVADALNPERGSYRSCRISRLSNNAVFPTSTHSSDDLAQNGAASDAHGFSGASNHVSTPPSDGLSEEIDASNRPSRRIKPVSRNLLLIATLTSEGTG